VLWERRNATASGAPRGGLLTTAGGLLFGSDGSRLYALDAASGAQLWSFDTGGHISAPPITYRLGNQQVIAVVAGHVLLTFALADAPIVATTPPSPAGSSRAQAAKATRRPATIVTAAHLGS
jgi:outer membrane protein assembly factor BamB